MLRQEVKATRPGTLAQPSASLADFTVFLPVWARRLGLILLGVLLLSCGITRQSLWIDEGFTALGASQPSLHSLFVLLHNMSESAALADPHYAGYYSVLWMWVRLFGSSEIALRALNLVGAVIFAASLCGFGMRIQNGSKRCIILCAVPFAFYYMNEARPYMLLLGLSCLATVSLLLAFDSEHPRIFGWACSISLLAAWSIQMLAFFLVPGLITVGLLLARRKGWKALVEISRATLFLSPLYTGVGLYYLRTLVHGPKGFIQTPGLGNLAFVLYEFCGMAGLGPPRNDLRVAASFAAARSYWPTLALGVLAVVAILYLICCSFYRKNLLAISLLTGFMVSLAIFCVAARMAHYRFLGRHLAEVMPLFLIALLVGNVPSHWRGMCAWVVIAAAWMTSDIRLVTDPAYFKDDTRSTVTYAQQAVRAGKRVIWVADPVTALYYGLNVMPFPRNFTPGTLTAQVTVSGGVGWSASQIEAELHRGPLLLILSKRDPFDPEHKWVNACVAHKATVVSKFNDFDVWSFS